MARTVFQFAVVAVLGFTMGLPVGADDDPLDQPVKTLTAISVESFQKSPEKPWEWIRENPATHRSSEKGLEIQLEPGGLMGGGKDAKNILVRPWPDKVQTVSVKIELQQENQFEQGGLILYGDDDTYIKLVGELVDGVRYIVMVVEVGAEIKGLQKISAPEGANRIAFSFEGEKVHVWAFNAEKRFQRFAETPFPMETRPRIGVFTQSGHPGVERWARFWDFGMYQEMMNDVRRIRRK